MNKKHLKRFEELEQQSEIVLATKKVGTGTYSQGTEYVDQNTFDEWRIKVKSLIANSCGKESEHYSEFVAGESPTSFESNLSVFKRLKAIFNAAREDFEGGYLISVRTLVQAEVFDSELEQATELLKSNYPTASAVIAGIVLETSLRELCDRNNIPHGKMDKMNADLTKAGVYNSLQQKRITAIAGIRNSAAHGKHEEFTRDDVSSMISDIERFLLTYLLE
ncbi:MULTISPECIES: DUF4145 domain-containing protein [Gammaproteobacteria]|uniref:DUF4145 domain-containing protein n=1 Tax=Gammaproteobacteria TaxID=1236 RepID=UPI0007DC2362|nr:MULTISPECIES: DUF4145 domain-containing protein [Gammaproteobacteria]AVW95405.1 DUF4145 domain-containing protein [Vibrio parahaemolyticus]EGQ8739634.1 DUF4145 domain-containing protein [Vibrio parahaemolyticus]EGQ8907638.1 DUF4145 domain-containing protein [Vibrio parahaemolyticus]EGR3101796.1 DUF4145 domain-containing protein [Vibrio parahaemolyticus]EHY0996609.1 DUF4145 domain-containing protein [Vibrio parahaemolyticus]